MSPKLIDWLPFALIVTGIILGGLGIQTILVQAGLLCYGFIGVIDSVKKKYFANFLSLRFLKLVCQVVIAALALLALVEPISLFVFLMLILMDRIILTPDRL